MIANDRVHLRGDHLHLPGDLYFLMACPRWIAIVERKSYFYLWAYDYNFIASKTALVIKAKTNLTKDLRLGEFSELTSEGAVYATRDRTGQPCLPDGEYGVVNKVTNFLLMPVAEENRAADREAVSERLWSDLDGYHEHLPPEQQAGFAHKISSWFAEEVLLPFAASSFLEIGCGSGRNLVHINRVMPKATLSGIDVNQRAVEVARSTIKAERTLIHRGSLYALDMFQSQSVDVVFSMGVLMHISHARVGDVIMQMHRIARQAVIHFECHGPSYRFDYHKYPRNYADVYRGLKLWNKTRYQIFPGDDFRSRESRPFNLALLVAEK